MRSPVDGRWGPQGDGVMEHLSAVRPALARARLERFFLGVCLVLTAAGLTLAVAPGPSQAGLQAPASEPSLKVLVETPRSATDERWTTIHQPMEIFSLSQPGLAAGYSSERNGTGDMRRDTMRLGSLETGGTFAAVTVHRRPSIVPTLAETAQRLTGERTVELSRADEMTSKFGTMSSAQAAIASGADRRACIVFDRYEPSAQVAIDGIVCAPQGTQIDRRAVSCLVDRLDLLGGGNDPALRSYFSKAEKKRDFCGAGDLRTAGTSRALVESGTVVPLLRQPAGPSSR